MPEPGSLVRQGCSQTVDQAPEPGIEGALGDVGRIVPGRGGLAESENLSKNATPFEEWIKARDATFRRRHLIPEMAAYVFDAFDESYEKRRSDTVSALQALA